MRLSLFLVMLMGITLTVFAAADPAPSDWNAIESVSPNSTLLAAGTRTVTIDLKSSAPISCRYWVGQDQPYAAMRAFAETGGLTHSVTLDVNPDPAVVTNVYVRADTDASHVLHLIYRCIAAAKPHYPRVGNLWGSWQWIKSSKSIDDLAKVDLWMGADFKPDQIARLRQLNPNVLILISINTVENNDVPDDYFLRDVNGKKIEVWPGAYRLNLTRPEVAKYQAEYAYHKMLASGLDYDGCFFDNVMLSQSWLKHDIYGNPVQIDANGDGKADDPAWLDAAWRAGVMTELQTWRSLMPNAIMSGHFGEGTPDKDILSLFNGQSIGFATVDAIEGRMSFDQLWQEYDTWCNQAEKPQITMVESAVPSQIGYGYDYEPDKKMPASTLDFARNDYPYMRFGLCFTLMQDGYFTHEIGDTLHGSPWWYDELDYDLGTPLGKASMIAGGAALPEANGLDNGAFDRPIANTWHFDVNKGNGCVATLTEDFKSGHAGASCAHVSIASDGKAVPWDIALEQLNRMVKTGTSYKITFWAKSSQSRPITIGVQKGVPDWDNYGAWDEVSIGTEWKEYSVFFTSNATASDARVAFNIGQDTGDLWLDTVPMTVAPPQVYERQFTKGLVYVNGTNKAQTIAVPSGYRRLTGTQAPKYDTILDNDSAAFSHSGDAAVTVFDSGKWKAEGPFCHNWGKNCVLLAPTATGKWTYQPPANDKYTVTAWWPAAPSATGWSKKAEFVVRSGDQIVARTDLDQTANGDEWHTIADNIPLTPGGPVEITLTSQDGQPVCADALHITSSSRYNDGSAAHAVTLAPMDGIILRKDGP